MSREAWDRAEGGQMRDDAIRRAERLHWAEEAKREADEWRSPEGSFALGGWHALRAFAKRLQEEP